MANQYFRKGLWTSHNFPVLLDCNFIVDSTNGNGLGIRSLKGQYISNVYMHTTVGSAPLNPNPLPGTIVIQLNDNYTRYFGGFSGFVSPIGSSSTSTTAHTPVVITVLGTATLAQWQAKGLPFGITPAVGVAFVPTASGAIGGSAEVAPAATGGSGIDHIEVLGDPNTTITTTPTGNSQIVLQCYSEGVITAPVNGTVISCAMYLSNTSVMVDGE